MVDLVVFVPSRGRPGNLVRWCQSLIDTESTCDLVVAVDDDDATLGEYHQVRDRFGFELVIAPREQLVGTTNRNATVLADRYPYVGFAGDDHVALTTHWDQILVESARSAGVGGLAHCDDRLQSGRVPTTFVVDSRFITALGWLHLPSLVHLYGDDVLRDLSQAIGTERYLPDVVVEHLHPFAGKAEWDATYEAANSELRCAEDKRAYEEWRYGGGFELSLKSLKAGLGCA